MLSIVPFSCFGYRSTPTKVAHKAIEPCYVYITNSVAPHVYATPADHAYKVRVHNPDECCACATYVGPTYGGIIQSLKPFKAATTSGSWLAYCTPDRVVGLMSWPLDGDPSRSMGLIAHPGAVCGMAVSFDGRKLITAGDHVRCQGCLAVT